MHRYAALPDHARATVAGLLCRARQYVVYARALPERADEFRYYAWRCKQDARKLARIYRGAY